MLGAIIGDIAGSTYEVEEIKAIKEGINYEKRIRILNNKVPLFNEDSSYTDDTVLTASIADAIINSKDYEEILKEYGNREINLGLDKYGRNRFGKGFCDWLKGDYIGNSYGNGCAMRISPIANYYDNEDDVLEETIKATRPSHNHEDSYLGVMAVSTCIYLAKNKQSKEKIKSYIELKYGYDLNYNLEELQRTYKFTSKAKESVPQAIFCFLESNDFEDAIRKAISIGGDSDTIAAITGSIAEAYYEIDEKLIKEVEKYLPEYIINITNEFYKRIGKEEPFKNKLKEFFKVEQLYSEEFFDFIKNKVHVLPPKTSLDWYGYFPILEDNKIKDIRLLVPEIIDDKTLLINIHEYFHALELFNELGTIYEERREERENKAKEMEKKYIKNKPI